MLSMCAPLAFKVWCTNKIICKSKFNLSDISTYKYLIEQENIKYELHNAFYWACNRNNLQLIEYIYDCGIDIEACVYDIINCICIDNNLELLRFLLEKRIIMRKNIFYYLKLQKQET